MKTLFALILMWSISTAVYAQQLIVKYPGFTAYYNTKTLIPDSVIWTISKAHLVGQKVPRVNRFHPETGSPNLKRDYVHSGYDQGHNSPYDDNYWSADAEYQCFSYANMFPQLHKLNAQTWERLEDYCRKLAMQYDSVNVKTSWRGVDKTIGRDSVVVPLICIKDIWYNGRREHYEMPNRDTVINHPYTYYLVR